MSYEIGTATNAADLLNKLNTFLTAKGKAYGLSYTGTGTGALTAWDGGASSVSETFTITATSATSFTVVGSVSGSIGTATVGSTFTHGKLTFLVSSGGTAFVAGDVFKINTCPPWVNQRAVAGSEMIWLAPGNDGLRQIYVGALLFSDAGADYYNWRIGGFNGYSRGQPFASQLGYSGNPSPILTLWNNTMPYWFVANGQRVTIFVKVSTLYMSAYMGLINTYVAPGVFPYPLFIGGNMAWSSEPAANSTNWRYSYAANYQMHSFWRGCPSYNLQAPNCAGRLRIPDGTYLGTQCYDDTNGVSVTYATAMVWPFACESPTAPNRGFQDIRENLDGTYPLIPIVLHSDKGPVANVDTTVWGELDGIRATTGHANAPENTIKEGPLTYVVFQDVFRNEKDCFCALALD